MDLKEFFKPTKGKIVIFVIFIILGYANWYIVTSEILRPTDITDAGPGIVSFLPGLFLPMIFDEGVVSDLSDDIKTNFIAWECDPVAWTGPIGPTRAEASCNVQTVSIIYTLIYWYLLSSLIVWIYNKVKINRSHSEKQVR